MFSVFPVSLSTVDREHRKREFQIFKHFNQMSQPTRIGAIQAQIVQTTEVKNPNFLQDESRLEWKRQLFVKQSKLVACVDPSTGQQILRPRFTLKGKFKNPQPGQQKQFYFQGAKNLIYLNERGHNLHSIVQGLEMQVKLLKTEILNCTIYDNEQQLSDQVIFRLLSDGTELFRERLTEYLMFKKL